MTEAAACARTRRVFEAEVRRAVGNRPRDVALLLGAGVDGTTVGLAGHHLGHRVHAYTFQLGDVVTHDSKWAERTARIMGWQWTRVVLPTSVHAIVRAWPRLYHELRCRKKREFECAWPFLWVYPAIRERYVLNGLHAGTFFGLSRRAYKSGASGPDCDRATFDAYRRGIGERIALHGPRTLDQAYNPSCMLQHRLLQREFGLVDVNPFVTRAAYDHFMRYSWAELNLPQQKSILRGTYEDHQRVGMRNHRGYQEAGRIIEHFEKVLDTPVNYMRRGRTIDMFGDWWRPGRDAEREAVIRRIERHYGGDNR